MEFNDFMKAEDETRQRGESKTRKLIEALEENPNKPILLEDLANQAGLKVSSIKSALLPLKKAGKVVYKRIGGQTWLCFLKQEPKPEEKPDDNLRNPWDASPDNLGEEIPARDPK